MSNERRKVFGVATVIGAILFGGIALLNNLPDKEIDLVEEYRTKITYLTEEEYRLSERVNALKKEEFTLRKQISELIKEFNSLEQYIEVKRLIDEGNK